MTYRLYICNNKTILLIAILLILFISYYIKLSFDKHSNIIEKFNNLQIYQNNVELRDCQVYFTTDIQGCDNKYNDDPYDTCKYKFEGWKELQSSTESNNNNVSYANKIYIDGNLNKSSFTNVIEDTRCFYPLTNENIPSDNIYTLNNSKYIGKDLYPFNINDKVCSSIKPIKSSLISKMFYKFIIGIDNSLTDIKKVSINEKQNGFIIDNDYNIDTFTKEQGYGLAYSKDKTFNLFQVSKFEDINIKIYRFKYNYLCHETQITSFSLIDGNLLRGKFIQLNNNDKNSITSVIDIKIPDFNWNNYKNSKTEKVNKRPSILIALHDKKQAIETKILNNLEETRNELKVLEDGINLSENTSSDIVNKFKINNDKPNVLLKDKFKFKNGFFNKRENQIIPEGNIPIVNTQVETITGVNGWRLVRFLPPNSNRWYSGNDNLEGKYTIGTAYLYSNEWSISFGDFDEFCFSTFNFKHWLHCTKDSVNGKNYIYEERPIIKSSISAIPYSAAWYNRGGSFIEEPWIGLKNYGTNGDIILYGENSQSNHWSLPVISSDGGMCVWVRKSTLDIPTIQPYQLYNNIRTEYLIYDFTPHSPFDNWIAYAKSFGASTNRFNDSNSTGIWSANNSIGELTYPLPDTHDYIEVTFNNPHPGGQVNVYLDNVFKMSASAYESKTYSSSYKKGQIFKIDETNTAIIGRNLIIKLSKQGIDTSSKYYSLTNTSGDKTQYTINFLEETVCDILVVGGGGGGGNGSGTSWESGGGGGGGVVYMVNKTITKETYNINVGKGGIFKTNGFDSSITNNTGVNILIDGIKLVGIGGGGGTDDNGIYGKDGGSGGGGCHASTRGGSSIQGNTFWNGNMYVPGGYSGERPPTTSSGGGGGGSAENGGTDGRGFGGDGRLVSITGKKIFYAGGGTGSIPGYTSYTSSDGDGGVSNIGLNSGNTTSGKNNTGSGGGGGYTNNGSIRGGDGGSGIVIIKYYNKKGDPDYELTKFNKYTKKSHTIYDIKNFDKKENFTINIPTNNKEPYNNYLSSFIFLQNANYKFRFDIEESNRNIYNIREIRLYNNGNLNNNDYLVVALDNKTTNKWVKIAIGGIYRIELIVISINIGMSSEMKFSIKAVYNTGPENDLLTFDVKEEIKYEDNIINVFNDITNLMFIDDKLLDNTEYIKINNIFNTFLFEKNSDNFDNIIQYFEGKYDLPNDAIRIANKNDFDSKKKTYENRVTNDLSGDKSIQTINYMYNWINEIVIEQKMDMRLKPVIKPNTNITDIFNINQDILIQYITFEQTKDNKDYGKYRSIYLSIF
jgi:hypothetical protein